MKEQLRVFSYGGGVQSTAALVLAAQGTIDFTHFVFANVGDDSEHPATLRYVHDVAMPYAAANGVNLEEVRREWKDGRQWTLYQHVMRGDRVGVQLPVRFANGAVARRHCTVNYKIEVLARWQKAHGASADNPAIVGLGISWDEMHRMRTDSEAARRLVYPLVDLRMTRQECMALIGAAGLPVPGRSSCFFCPHHNKAQWQAMRHEEPSLFARAVAMEAHMSTLMAARGEGPVTMHTSGPLLKITTNKRQLGLFDEPVDACEGGYCMT